jgi:uncharacterized membrane protein SirB2
MLNNTMKTKIFDTLILISMIILFALAHVSPLVGIIMMSLAGNMVYQILGAILQVVSIAGLVYIHYWNGTFRSDKKDLD